MLADELVRAADTVKRIWLEPFRRLSRKMACRSEGHRWSRWYSFPGTCTGETYESRMCLRCNEPEVRPTDTEDET